MEAETFKLRPSDYAIKFPKWPGLIGLEIEMQPVHDGGTPKPERVVLQGQGGSIAKALKTLAAKKGWPMETTTGERGEPLLLYVKTPEGDMLSFEPGGQVEFSSKPYPCLSDAVRRMSEMQGVLGEALEGEGIELVQVGINPWHTVEELGLQMAKGRYRAMDHYFSTISEYGQRMMRQTCTVQVNLDFGANAETLARRYLAAMLLAPIAAATFANSPVVDRKMAGIPGFRTRVWRHVDPSRTGLPGLQRVAERPTRDTCIDTYLDFALDARVVFVEALDFKVPERPVTFGEWIARPIEGVSPTLKDFTTHMTLLFPEVRPRGFLELRSIDCLPRAWQAVPAAYMTGLLYDQESLEKLLELLLPTKGKSTELLRRAERGLHDEDLKRLAPQVMGLAIQGFARQPDCFKSEGLGRDLERYDSRFTSRGRTPADDVTDRLKKDDAPFLTLAALKDLEREWTNP